MGPIEIGWLMEKINVNANAMKREDWLRTKLPTEIEDTRKINVIQKTLRAWRNSNMRSGYLLPQIILCASGGKFFKIIFHILN